MKQLKEILQNLQPKLSHLLSKAKAFCKEKCLQAKAVFQTMWAKALSALQTGVQGVRSFLRNPKQHLQQMAHAVRQKFAGLPGKFLSSKWGAALTLAQEPADAEATFYSRARILKLGLFGLSGFYGLACFTNFGLVQGLNPDSDEAQETIIASELKNIAYEGQFFDRNGTAITERSTEPGVAATVVHNTAWSHLIGYFSNLYGKRGLRSVLSEYIYETLNSENRGCDVTLTLDSDLQVFCNTLLADNIGCIVVMDSHSGAVYALANQSYTDFNINDPSEFLADTTDGNQLTPAYNSYPAGSVFKVVTAAAALNETPDNWWNSGTYDYYDNGSYWVYDYAISNAGGAAYGEVDLAKGLYYSINTYFAHLGSNVVSDESWTETAQSLWLNTDVYVDWLGDSPLTSNFDLSSGDALNQALVSFGQGNLLVSPVQLAAIFATVSNGGDMPTPYMIDSISQDDTLLHQGRATTLTDGAMTSKTAATLLDYLEDTAAKYGLQSQSGSVIAKTGTAQVGNDAQGYHCYLAFTLNKDDGTSLTCLISHDCASSSSVLYSPAQSLLSKISTFSAS